MIISVNLQIIMNYFNVQDVSGRRPLNRCVNLPANHSAGCEGAGLPQDTQTSFRSRCFRKRNKTLVVSQLRQNNLDFERRVKFILFSAARRSEILFLTRLIYCLAKTAVVSGRQISHKAHEHVGHLMWFVEC